MITAAIRSIFTANLGIKRHERILVFTDTVSKTEELNGPEQCGRERLRDIALLTAEIGKSYAKKVLYYEYPATGSHGAEPPVELWRTAFGEGVYKALQKAALLDALLSKSLAEEGYRKAVSIIGRYKRSAVDAVIALSHYSTSHTQFRKLLTDTRGCRYASMPLFDMAMFEGPMAVDWKALAKQTREAAREVNTAEIVEMTAPNGSHLTVVKKRRKALADTGILTRPGAFGNLPAGEVFFAPLEGTAQGLLVLEWSPTRQLTAPVTLVIKDGLVQDISGDEPYAAALRSKIGERPENRNIAEFGIGTNNRAKRPDNILESEKILGTIHIAFGDNSSFGGNIKTPFHQDFVFFKPTVTLVKKDNSRVCLLKNGHLNLPFSQ